MSRATSGAAPPLWWGCAPKHRVSGLPATVDAVAIEKAFLAERHVAIVRALVVLFNSVVYLLLLDPAIGVRWLALVIVIVACSYSGFVVIAAPYRRFPVLVSSWFTTTTDAALITFWLLATGGVASPFFVVWYVSLAAVAFRFDALRTMACAGVYVLCYVGLAAFTGELVPRSTEVLVRSGYILLVAALGALMATETVAQIASKLEMRSRMEDARASERSIRQLVEAAPDAVVIADRKGRITLVNSQAEKLFGWTRAELLGAPASMLLPAFVAAIDPALLAGAPSAPQEFEARRKDAAPFPAELTVSAFETADGPALTAVVRDVSERRRAEGERARSAANLEELNRFREIDTVKTQFINTAAHELGTPLTPIRIQLHMLKNGRVGDLSQEQSRALRILDRNVDRLATLVTDMLDAAKVQSHKLVVERASLDLGRVVEECVESFLDPAAQGGVVIVPRIERGLEVLGDGKRVTQVMFNLLSNALKFTPRGGRVIVEAHRDGERAVVLVRDSGVGIRAEDVGKLFKPFSQVHDTSDRTRGGTGLGLYISKGIVEHHEGEMWVTSEGVGSGSTFAFAIPLALGSARPNN